MASDDPWVLPPTPLASALERVLPRVTGGLAPVAFLVYVNVQRWNAPHQCSDCGERVGTPFAFWMWETFAGGDEVLWLGLLGDVAIAAALAALGAFVAERAYRKFTS
jgi:hypothetical protein